MSKHESGMVRRPEPVRVWTTAWPNRVGDVLRVMREEAGLPATQVAKAAGVNLTTVKNVEAGTSQPSWPTLRALLGVYGYEVAFYPVAKP